MRYVGVLLAVLGGVQVYAQCNACTPDGNQSPRPYGFNPAVLYVRPNTDTTLVIYFTFPDEVQQGSLTVYPNYAIWVDSLKLDSNRITRQDGQPFAYATANPPSGPMHFDQLHRYKQYSSGNSSNFVVYQNPGGTAGQTPPIGCARVCVRGGASEGSDTLRVKVRAFVPALGDGANKDTTNLSPTLLGQPAWLDTIFRYVVVVTATPPSASLAQGNIATFTLAPNPAIHEAIATFSLLSPSTLSIRVFTTDGREVYRHLDTYTAGEHRHSLRLPAGYYRVVVETPAGRSSQSLIVVE